MEKLVEDVIDALPDWDDIRDEAEKAATAVGDWAGDAGRALRKRTDEQTTWFVIGGVSVLAIIIGLAWWRRNRSTEETPAT